MYYSEGYYINSSDVSMPFGRYEHLFLSSFFLHSPPGLFSSYIFSFLSISWGSFNKFSKTGWLHEHLLSHSFGCFKSKIKVSAGLAPSEGCEGKSIFSSVSLPCGQPLALFGPQKYHPDICLHLHMVPSLCPCLCIQTSPFYNDHSHIKLELKLTQTVSSEPYISDDLLSE